VLRVVVIYTGIRIGLFLLAGVAGFLLGLRSIVLVAVALVASGLLSYPLARRQRDALTAALSARRQRRALAAEQEARRRQRGAP
jgi:hypothetical protein